MSRLTGILICILVVGHSVGCSHSEARPAREVPATAQTENHAQNAGQDTPDARSVATVVADAATPVEAAYQAPKDETHSLIGRLETNQLRNLLTTVLREGKRDFYPVDEGMVVEPQASTDVSIGGRDIIAVPAFVRFTQNANTYCNLVVLHRETGRAELVAEPDAFACRGIQEAAKLDLNGDGVVDFIYLVDMPSNRANVIMSVPAVYLSNVRDATYCYGSNASEALMIAGANRSSFKKTIESDVRRLGKSVLDCWQTRSP